MRREREEFGPEVVTDLDGTPILRNGKPVVVAGVRDLDHEALKRYQIRQAYFSEGKTTWLAKGACKCTIWEPEPDEDE